jgi:4-hydroxybenzoate polyprenyltransferase
MSAGLILKLMRPKQWAKNLLIFAAAIFTARLNEPEVLVASGLAFVAYCLVSSGVYTINDIFDVERDRAHPKKKNRPIASGAISPGTAWILALVLLVSGCAISYSIHQEFLIGIGGYLLLQVIYNAVAKRIPVLDVFTVAAGFVLRAAMGAIAIQSVISGWLLFCTGALALMLSFGKRRSEFLDDQNDSAVSRPALAGYTANLLDMMVVFSAALAALSYGIYAIESTTAEQYPSLMITTPFVLYGVARYLYLAFANNDGSEPENILWKDPHIGITIILFITAALYAVTGKPLPYVGPPGL